MADRGGAPLLHLGMALAAIPLCIIALLACIALGLPALPTVIITTLPLALLQTAAMAAGAGMPGAHAFTRLAFWTLKLFQKPLGIQQHAPERMVIAVNNRRASAAGESYAPDETLILLPHCLQVHTCPHRLTFDTGACTRCGNCPVGPLLDLADRFGIPVAIATGGTSARKVVRERKPKLIIAVACPVDLSLGILDVHPVETVGILNEWRHGACIDTWVDVSRVEDAIRGKLGPRGTMAEQEGRY